MAKQYKLKQEKGVLHVGGGRLFYPNEDYDLTEAEAATYGHYFNEEQISDPVEDGISDEKGDSQDDELVDVQKSETTGSGQQKKASAEK
jgi:hypothetical protein